MKRFLVVLLLALIPACSGPPEGRISPVETTPRPIPPVILPDALPVPRPSPWHIRSGEQVDHPTSANVALGQQLPFTISTHCGFDFRVDFDGSFWQAYTHEAYAPVYGVVHGTMTLLTEEVAVFRFKTQGTPSSVYLVRNDTPKPERGCA
jgi:hypothetical protein